MPKIKLPGVRNKRLTDDQLAPVPAECLAPGEASPVLRGNPASAPAERCRSPAQNLSEKHPATNSL